LIPKTAVKKHSFLLLFCSLLTVTPSTSVSQPAPLVKIISLPNGVELADGPSLLDVKILESGVVDVHVRPEGASTARTLVIAPHPSLRAPSMVMRSDKAGVYSLSTPGMTVQIQETRPFSITFDDSAGRQLLRSADPLGEARATGVTMEHSPADVLYGVHGLGREDTDGALTRNDGGRVAAGVQGDSGAPFIFSVRYGLLVDSDGGAFTTEPGSLSFRQSSRPDVEYFVFTGPPLETMAALSRVVGPPPLPPEWTLGFLNSQWGSTQSEVEQIIAKYRSKQLPIDGFILDFDWKAWGEDNYGEWRWNSTSGPGNVAPDKFPGGASGDFAREMRAEGVKLAGILKPRILLTAAGDPNRPTEAAAYATSHGFWYPGEEPMPDYFSHRMARDLDFSNPDERKWYWEHLVPSFRSGMVAWWNDEADLSGTTIFNNFQFLNMGRTLYEGQRADSNIRVWSINRSFYLGASRYGYAGWSGDIDTGFASMAFQRRRMLAALDTGEFHWSMDTGGFSGHPGPENYARWIEFAAFVPIMRVHGGLDEKRQPWVYGPIAEDAARHALDLRYQLLPYIYSYERRNTEGDVGLVRPLFWEFPSDPAAATQESEWMFGDSLLVAPVVNEGAAGQQIYLPAGNWFDYASGRRYSGGQNIDVAVDSKTWKDIPLFVRSGSILATQPLEQFVGQHPIIEITLDIFPAQSFASFVAYDDDGETYNYEKGDYLRQQISAKENGNETAIRVDASTGNYSARLRSYLLRIHSAARKVTLNGKPLPQTGTSAADLTSDGNWLLQNDRFGPVVLIRIPAGKQSVTTISLR
jgi:alpha-glucosidase